METYIIIFVFFILLSVIILTALNTFVFPKKIEEIAKMIEAGQTKLAIKKINDILEKDDRNAYAHFLLAKAYLAESNYQYAIVELRQVLKFGRFDDKIREIDVRENLATLLLQRKAIEPAKKELLILTKLDPANYENYFQLGKIFYNVGVVEKAAGFFKKALAANPKHEESSFYLGQVYYKARSFPDAKQIFLETIKINPSNYKAHYYLGLVLRSLSDYEWAIKEFEIAQKDDQLKVKCFLAKGTSYLERGQDPKAIMEFERGLKFAPKGSEAELNIRYYLAESHEKMRDVQVAIHNWEKIVEIKPNFKDVKEKLNHYAEFRQDDRIKDFLIVGLSQFEHLVRKMIQTMGFRVLDVDIISDVEIEVVAVEMEGKWRNARQSNRIIRVIRSTETVPESLLRRLHESMKTKNATRVMIITTGDVSPQGVEFANSRPIEILGKKELIDLLKKTS